jgi:apolipoprotein N-acyltransferase
VRCWIPAVGIQGGDEIRVPATVEPVFDRYPLVLSAAAGGLLFFAFPPYGFWPLAPVAVALLTLVVHGRGPGWGAGQGLIFGVTFFVPLLSWSGIEVGAAPWLILSAVQALFCTALGAALPLVQRLRGWPLWVACLWVAQEWARSRVPFGGFPWGRLAFSQPHTWFTPYAAYGGAPLVTFAVALCGALLAAAYVAALRRGRPRQLLFTAAAVAGVPLVALAAAVGVSAGHADPQVTVAVVQGNVPRLGLDFNAQRAAVLDNHVQRTLDLADRVRSGELPKPAFVVWPENSSDIDPLVNGDARQAIDKAARAIGVPILVGTVLDGPGENVRNAGIVWDPERGPGQIYVKRHPVPFAEYIPLRSLARLVSKDVDRVRHDFVAGASPGVLTLGGRSVGDVICFEVAYDGLVRDAAAHSGLLVVQTNNATFDRSGETYQQLAMGRLRAVEYGRTVVVAATSGVSAVIGPDGTVFDQSAVFTPDLLVEPVPVRGGLTLAARLGALPEWLASLAGLAAVGWAVWAPRVVAAVRRRAQDGTADGGRVVGGRVVGGRVVGGTVVGGTAQDGKTDAVADDAVADDAVADEEEETETV